MSSRVFCCGRCDDYRFAIDEGDEKVCPRCGTTGAVEPVDMFPLPGTQATCYWFMPSKQYIDKGAVAPSTWEFDKAPRYGACTNPAVKGDNPYAPCPYGASEAKLNFTRCAQADTSAEVQDEVTLRKGEVTITMTLERHRRLMGEPFWMIVAGVGDDERELQRSDNARIAASMFATARSEFDDYDEVPAAESRKSYLDMILVK